MVNFGFIGTNFISDWMAEGAKHDPRFRPLAVYSRAAETGRAFADRHGFERVYTSLDDMLADPDIDAVYVASPNALHASQSICCLEHGKHVLCEKPMASNAREVEAMIAAARANDRLLMEAMIPTLSPNFKVVRDNLYRVGTVRRYFASYCQYSSRYDAFKQGNVANAFKPELSNGGIMDIGVYCLYPMVALFGVPLSVLSTARLLSTGVDAQGTVVATYDDFDGVVIYSKIADSVLPTEIQGEEGTLIIDRINNPRSVQFKPHDKSLPIEDLTVPTPHGEYYEEMRHFIDLIESGRRESPLNSLANSLATVSIIDTLRARAGIRFPADKQ
ncbi:MAG: Gfo/Idh/MocA family oxidoreductase [Muribaculaceae bacterium]|nr:Gfo/Idh/MocA family oxidoreductase [Muribaculaceae bacterium]